MQRLLQKQIILGVTGGIAAYKSADLVRRLREAGASVRVVMTENAKEFITPLTMQAVSGMPVHEDLFDVKAEAAMGHIELARWADLIVVAPATADFMARFVSGEANDLLTTLCLAAKAPVALAPAMNQAMWKNTMTQKNVQALQEKKIALWGPVEGSQACGDVGPGRMMEPLDILERVYDIFAHGSLVGQRVLITTGATREAIDPVRYISSGSSGKMGFALAAAAVEAGASVTLICAPVNLDTPQRVKQINVVSADEMLAAVMQEINACDIFISVAAVADYKSKTSATQKIAKTHDDLTLTLTPNPDIVASVAALEKRPVVIGFAAETHDVIKHATYKLNNKKLDMIIANQVGAKESGMGADDNQVTVLWPMHSKMQQQEFPLQTKAKLARSLIELIAKQFVNKPSG
jgi:phosphopantothenoylcysteine decarboxylase / phosphopantothenate---cysteine ligase